MKNRLILIFFYIISLQNIGNAEILKFETENIILDKEKNEITSGKGKVLSNENNFEIFSDQFIYKKNLNLLTSNGNGLIVLKDKKIEINFDKLSYNKKDLIFNLSGKIKVTSLKNKFVAETENITLDQYRNIIISDTQSRIIDKNKNKYLANNFKYEIDNDLLKLNNVFLLNEQEDNFKSLSAYLNFENDQFIAKDIEMNFRNNIEEKNQNQPRLKGNSLRMNNDKSIISKGIFTNCKKRDGCPPWQIKSSKIIHDKKEKIIFYEDAVLEIYDRPVVYFPKFFHPDPTVKRQSGFLVPSIKSSKSSKNFLNTPYFLVLSDNKDATFSPRFYGTNKFLLQSEYRQVNKNSAHIFDTSFFKEKDKNSQNHFFYKYNKFLNNNRFNESILDINIQQVSNDTYLRNKKMNSPLINDLNNLENSTKLELNKDDLFINFESYIYEDLNKLDNDRYEYIIPKINIVKYINDSAILDGSFTLETNNQITNYNTNVDERLNINNIIFNSNSKLKKFGVIDNYEFLIRNTNSDSTNSKNFKDDSSAYLGGIFQYNLSLPLIKKNNNIQKIFTPKASLKISPDYTKDKSNKNMELNLNNIYNIDRIGDNDALEGGKSIAFGAEYSYLNLKKNRDIFNLKVANNFRLEENQDLPTNNQINQKTSNIFSEITYNPNRFFKSTYKNSLKNNLSNLDSENLISEIKLNNIVATFDYLNRNSFGNDNSYLSSSIKYNFDEFNNLSFATRKNKTIDLTEFYNLMYQYKNDCLSASIEYSKEYYQDRDVKPEESLFFKIAITPFGGANTPNLVK